MNFENFSKRINSLTNFNTFEKQSAEVLRLSVLKAKMQKKKVVKTKFSQLNDKRFYSAKGITFLPLCHPDLKGLCELKKRMDQRIERYFRNEKANLSRIENKSQELNEGLFLYHQILMSEPLIFLLNQKKKSAKTRCYLKIQKKSFLVENG